MRIVRRPQFLAMPAGTVFMRYRPCVFEGLMIKGETIGQDFTWTDLVGAVAWGTSGDYFERCEAMERGRQVPANFEAWGRDAQFESDEQLYAVYSPKDVEQLVLSLRRVRSTQVAEEWVDPQDGTWDGLYSYQITAPHLSSPTRGHMRIDGPTAADQRTGRTGTAECPEQQVVVIRWNDATVWSIHRAETGVLTLIADKNLARIQKELTA